MPTLRGSSYIADFKLPSGKRIKRSLKTGDLDLAIEREAELKSLETDAFYAKIDPYQVTLAAAVERAIVERYDDLSSGAGAAARLRKIVTLMPQGILLRDVKAPEISTLKGRLRGKGKTKVTLSTVHHYLTNLRTVLRMARDEWQLLESIPKIRIPQAPMVVRRVVEPDEFESMVQVFRQKWPEMADVLYVLYDTGMRLGECLKMTYSRHIKDGSIGLTFDITKSHKPRTVPMTKRVQDILNKRRETYGNRPFPYTSCAISMRFRKAKGLIGLKNDPCFCTHALRHSCASRLIEKGVHPVALRNLLGHSSLAVTDIYSHMDTQQLQAAINTLD